MRHEDHELLEERDTKTAKPRIALMGEFSAGKSTLSNLLIGGDALPVKVTATQLPPVWMSSGDFAPFAMDVDDEAHDVDLDRLEDIDVHSTKYLRIFRDVDILQLCHLIDMPGISDPNMSSEVWERVIGHVDAVLWCTHATQAWRQSEAAVWATLPAELKKTSGLLLTRMDKILSERDRRRVVRRVEKETEGEFAAVFPISLTDAIAAGDDRDAWAASGAENFTKFLIDLILSYQSASLRSRAQRERRRKSKIHRVQPGEGLKMPTPAKPRAGAVVPKRVTPKVEAQRRRAIQGPDAETTSAF